MTMTSSEAPVTVRLSSAQRLLLDRGARRPKGDWRRLNLRPVDQSWLALEGSVKALLTVARWADRERRRRDTSVRERILYVNMLRRFIEAGVIEENTLA